MRCVKNMVRLLSVTEIRNTEVCSPRQGDLVYMNALGQGILVLGSRRRAVDLLESRSTIYSDRPKLAATDL